MPKSADSATSLKNKLEELLEDSVSCERLEEPYLLPSGQSVSAKILNKLKTPTNPFTQEALPDYLPLNVGVATVLNCLKNSTELNESNEKLAKRLFVTLEAIPDGDTPNLLLKAIKEEVKTYQETHHPEWRSDNPLDEGIEPISEIKYWQYPQAIAEQERPHAEINEVLMQLNMEQNSLTLTFNTVIDKSEFIETIGGVQNFPSDFERGREWRGKAVFLIPDADNLSITFQTMLTQDQKRAIIFPSKEVRTKFINAIHFDENDIELMGRLNSKRDNLLQITNHELLFGAPVSRKQNNSLSQNLTQLQKDLNRYCERNSSAQSNAMECAKRLSTQITLLQNRFGSYSEILESVENTLNSSTLISQPRTFFRLFTSDPAEEVKNFFTRAKTLLETINQKVSEETRSNTPS